MNPRRQPSLPPRIPGFEYVGLLGMGGFADVFEYRQEFPRRPVAVKVLLSSSLDSGSQDAFFAEANIMAALSQHPSIVAIHQAAIAADGRPYFVMEYCAKPSLGARYRSERISVAEVLRTGIRVASAVETAHRSGVLHRDIKPANILATDFGWPALTDFGIAGAMGDQMVAAGMSIPWAPPELLGEAPVGDARSDVYSLAATLHTLLAGRSPFELRGQSNAPLDLIARIETVCPPTIDRVDVPQELNSILARAMQKHPDLRFSSALAFAHALQQIERQMQLPVTGIDVPEISSLMGKETDSSFVPQTPPAGSAQPSEPVGTEPQEEETRLRSITTISPQPQGTERSEVEKETRLRPITSIAAQTAAVPPPPDHNQDQDLTYPVGLSAPVHQSGPETLASPSLLQALPKTPPVQARVAPRQFKVEETTDPGYFKALRRTEEELATRSGQHIKTAVSILSVLALIAVLFFVGKNVLGNDSKQRQDDQQVFQDPPDGPTEMVPGVINVQSVRSSEREVTFTWENPNPQDADAYLWRIVDVGFEGKAQQITEPTVAVDLPPGRESVCIEISVVRSNGKASNTPTRDCS